MVYLHCYHATGARFSHIIRDQPISIINANGISHTVSACFERPDHVIAVPAAFIWRVKSNAHRQLSVKA